MNDTNKASNFKTYAPILEPSYVIESDGDAWFAHMNNFTNIMESDDYAFGKTPQEALKNFMGLMASKDE